MKDFRATVKRRIVMLVVCVVCALVFVIVAGIWGYRLSINSQEHMADFVHGMSAGAFAGFAAVMLTRIIGYARALKREEVLKALYIRENDERERMIQNKIGGTGYTFALCALLVAAVAMQFLDMKIGITLMAVAVFMALLKAGLKVYYHKKY